MGTNTTKTTMKEATSVQNNSKDSSSYDNNDNTYIQISTFTVMDLAGAERPTKTGEKRFSSIEMLLWEKSRYGTEVPTGAQCFIINFELSLIATEIRRATEYYQIQSKKLRLKQKKTTA